MKKIFITTVIGLFIFIAVYAEVIADINGGLKTGNFKVVAGFFNPTVELNLPGNEGLYSKAQAELLLKDFFSKNTPKTFVSKHDGVAQDGSKYSIGSLETSAGNYRTYFYLKNINGTFFIKELRIEREK